MKNQYKTILKVRKIFKLGYVPSRGRESYEVYTYEGYVHELANCFVHACLNLKNEQFEKFGLTIADNDVFRTFVDIKRLPREKVLKRVKKFIRSLGLQVNSCDKFKVAESNQWKVAFFFDKDYPDFHFMLQEKGGMWSSKRGRLSEVDYFDQLPERCFGRYKLCDVFMITNPYAKREKSTNLNTKTKGATKSAEREENIAIQKSIEISIKCVTMIMD